KPCGRARTAIDFSACRPPSTWPAPRSNWSAWWPARIGCARRSPSSTGSIQCEYYALEGVSQLMNNINLVKAHLNPGLEVSTVILTMYDGRTKLADQV